MIELECVVNLSEGRRGALIEMLAASVGGALLDAHSDPWHNRSVLTLASSDTLGAVEALTRASASALDLAAHTGVHPRLGTIDVVPFVPLVAGRAVADADLGPALQARRDFGAYVGGELAIPCFYYGPDRSLPELRRRAFVDLAPDAGPNRPHPRAGAICVGARPPLVAYNLYLVEASLELATSIAKALRCGELRALGFTVGDEVQVSCNLVDPFHLGPGAVYERVASLAPVKRAELVGLIPDVVLRDEPAHRWRTLGLSASATVESRIAAQRS